MERRTPQETVAAQLGLDPKTVRRYLAAAEAAGVTSGVLSDEHLRDVLVRLYPPGGRPRGDGWALCAAQREPIRRW